jgi:hypothetical protein
MKIGIRKLTLKKMISARLSVPRMVRHRLGLKMPRGFGFLTSPKRFIYNLIYSRLTISVIQLIKKTFK